MAGQRGGAVGKTRGGREEGESSLNKRTEAVGKTRHGWYKETTRGSEGERRKRGTVGSSKRQRVREGDNR